MAIPVGLNLSAVGVSSAWWLEAARQAEAAGIEAVWIWDHFISRGDPTDPMLECWTMLTAAAMATERLHLGSFVVNNVNRHPALLAAIVGTLADLAPGRVELGIGIGGHPAEHAAYGMDFPPATERAARLEEAIAVLRALLAGGPTDFEGRHYRLEAAHSFPRPDPAPRLIVAGPRPAGTRMAARLGDAWTCFADRYDELRPVFDEALDTAGRARGEVGVIVGIEPEEVDRPMADIAARWREKGATELIVHDVGPEEVERILRLV